MQLGKNGPSRFCAKQPSQLSTRNRQTAAANVVRTDEEWKMPRSNDFFSTTKLSCDSKGAAPSLHAGNRVIGHLAAPIHLSSRVDSGN
jgi:hypothetical protein